MKGSKNTFLGGFNKLSRSDVSKNEMSKNKIIETQEIKETRPTKTVINSEEIKTKKTNNFMSGFSKTIVKTNPNSTDNSLYDSDVDISKDTINTKLCKRKIENIQNIDGTVNKIRKTDEIFGPFGTQWIHDIQSDDILNEECQRRTQIVEKLMATEYPEQRSKEWFDLRDNKATASDGGCIVGLNHYEPTYKFILKKVLRPPFMSNKYCYHGKKLEKIATMIYEYRMNVKVEEFGLIAHSDIKYLAASPDGIIGKYKADGKSLTKYIGRMLEIKCPLSRKILMDGPIKGGICPIYYWVQVQLQLECCQLDECDFWQCEISEYESRSEFIEDTDPNETFRSKTSKFEKGCLIQVLPKNKINEMDEGKLFDVIYEGALFLYPPKIEMSPIDCDIWIAETMSNFEKLCPNGYFFDRVKYWKLESSKCVTINRDKSWLDENIPTIGKVWNYVEYLRKNGDKSKIIFDYIESMPIKNNKKIMSLIDFICNEPDENKNKDKYNSKILEIIEETQKNNKNKKPKIEI